FRRQPLKDCLCVRVCLMGVPVTKIRWVLKSYCLCVLTETSLTLSLLLSPPPPPPPPPLSHSPFLPLSFSLSFCLDHPLLSLSLSSPCLSISPLPDRKSTRLH